jgi:hypothetical protein
MNKRRNQTLRSDSPLGIPQPMQIQAIQQPSRSSGIGVAPRRNPGINKSAPIRQKTTMIGRPRSNPADHEPSPTAQRRPIEASTSRPSCAPSRTPFWDSSHSVSAPRPERGQQHRTHRRECNRHRRARFRNIRPEPLDEDFSGKREASLLCCPGVVPIAHVGYS